MSTIRLVMTLLVRNEEDILEAHLAYHFRRGVDFVVATDHRSDDRTSEILDSYARRGLLHLIHEPSDTYNQADLVTRMARLAATDFGADWVLNSDADEFHWPRAGGLKDVFAAIPPEFGALDMPSFHFLPRAGCSGSFYERMVVREVTSLKPIRSRERLTKRAHRARSDVVVSKGNHRVNAEGRPPDRDVQPASCLQVVPDWHPIEILHFPVRSYRQLEKKITLAAAGYPHGTLFTLPGGRALEEGIHVEPKKAAALPLYRQGRLREWYEAKILDDETVAEGIRQGRLMIDDRLNEFFKACGPEVSAASQAASGPDRHQSGAVVSTGAGIAWPAEPSTVAELRADLMRALRGYEAEHERYAHLEAKSANLKNELDAIKTSRWWRLGQVLYRLARYLDFRRPN